MSALRAEIDRLDREYDRQEAERYVLRDARVAALAAVPGNDDRLREDAKAFRGTLGTATNHYDFGD